MTDIKNFIDPSSQPGKDGLTVQRIDKLGADKQTEEEIIKKNPSGLLMAGFCTYVRKVLLFLASRSHPPQITTSVQEIRRELAEMKKTLEELTKKDLSQNPTYILRLSQTWQKLLESVHRVELLKRQKQVTLPQLKALIDSVQSYPQRHEHSLGFYLTNYSKREWLPFPFMELLRQLFEDYQSQGSKSQLGLWIASLSQLLI